MRQGMTTGALPARLGAANDLQRKWLRLEPVLTPCILTGSMGAGARAPECFSAVD